jgi:hypothetical protein
MASHTTKASASRGAALQLAPRVKVLLLCQAIASLLLIAFTYYQYQDHAASKVRNLVQCQRNLRLIYQALQAYRRDHQGEYPLVLTQIIQEHGPGTEGLYPRYIHDPKVFRCPAVSDLSFPPGCVGQTYGYDLRMDFPYGPLPDSRDPILQRRKQLRDALPRRFGKELTVVWCPAHAAPEDEIPGKRLALKADGRLVWEPGMGTEQEKLVSDHPIGYGPPGR